MKDTVYLSGNKPETEPNLITSRREWCCRFHGTEHFVACTSCRRHGGHTMRFEAIFHQEPTREEIGEVQAAQGFHPAGYGGPSRLVIEKRGGGYLATWHCSDTCD